MGGSFVEIHMRGRKRGGFSLIELMCVITIILILVGLMMGPIMRAYRKAKNFGWENDSYLLADRFADKMKQHFGSAPEYPALSADQLYEGGLIDSALRNFLRDKRVQYFPFSSKSADEMVILHVVIAKNSVYTLQKGDLKPKQ
jgi:prepilin-type N-terminal cleavage/methylation domain-containing protein